MYTATVINVMIASPNDVELERQVVRDCLQRWNNLNAEDKRLVLLPVGWDTHSSPEMGAPPQSVIERQVRKKCDLLVAVFGTRLGSPAGDAPSGTVAEIRMHRADNRPAMVYFSKVPVPPDRVLEEAYRKVVEFQRELGEEALYGTYNSIEEFRDKFYEQLSLKVLEYFSDLEPTPRTESTPRAPNEWNLPRLSEAAQQLLIAASESGGKVYQLAANSGTKVGAGGRDFVEQGDARSEARWKAAVRELVSNGAIEDRGHRGQVFDVTHEGYQMADLLKSKAD